MRQDIAEGAEDIGEESLEIKRSLGRAKEQASTLSTLGLSEREAVEYVLMLSRDEQRRQGDILAASGDRPGPSTNAGTEEGIFDVDMDEGLSDGISATGLANRQSPTSSPPFGATSSRSPPIRPLTRPVSGTPSSISSSYGRKLPLVVPSLSNSKIQISPRFQPEPMEAGGLSPTPLTLDGSLASSALPVPVPRTQDFPPVSTSGSVSSSGILTPTRKSSASASSSAGGVGGRNAWSSPLTSRTNSANGTPSSSPGVSRTSSVVGSFPQQDGVSWARRLSMSPVVAPVASVGSPASRAAAASAVGGSAETDSDVRMIEEEEDEELRFVLELSLAEERSRAAAAARA